jgi:hypothetical protein
LIDWKEGEEGRREEEEEEEGGQANENENPPTRLWWELEIRPINELSA